MAELTDREKEIAAVVTKLDKDKGKNPKAEGVYIPKDKRAPYNPDNLHKSKAQFIADEKKRIEDDAKIAAFKKDLKKPKVEAPTDPDPEEPESAVEKKAKSKKTKTKKS